jgi:23S rRNA (adenine2503-C2)-methyltransferase
MQLNPAVLTDLTIPQVEELVKALGMPAYRAQQVLGWVYQRLAVSYDEMTDLPVAFRNRLSENLSLYSLTKIVERESKDGTVKTLFRMRDGNTVEAALMLYAAGDGRLRTTVCLSTQVGCAIGCAFCATGQQGFLRNLTPGEMVDQVLYFARHVKDHASGESRHEHITNLVFMGMGEPLANYDAVMQSIDIITSPKAFGMGARSITVSTAGLVPQIKRLAEGKPQIGLAVSLHAASNSLRDTLVPLNRKYPLDVLVPACRWYTEQTGRRISFEYILFAGVNDSLEQAKILAGLLKGMNCHVNLIAANKTAGSLKPSPRQNILAFENELKTAGIQCTLRISRGQDIDAGCGQLRSRFMAK